MKPKPTSKETPRQEALDRLRGASSAMAQALEHIREMENTLRSLYAGIEMLKKDFPGEIYVSRYEAGTWKPFKLEAVLNTHLANIDKVLP